MLQLISFPIVESNVVNLNIRFLENGMYGQWDRVLLKNINKVAQIIQRHMILTML